MRPHTTVALRTLDPGSRFRDCLGRVGRLIELTPSGARISLRSPRRVRRFRTRWGEERSFAAAEVREVTVSADAPVIRLPETPQAADVAQVRRTMQELGFSAVDIDDEVRRMGACGR